MFCSELLFSIAVISDIVASVLHGEPKKNRILLFVVVTTPRRLTLAPYLPDANHGHDSSQPQFSRTHGAMGSELSES